jgi:hypothetical protein
MFVKTASTQSKPTTARIRNTGAVGIGATDRFAVTRRTIETKRHNRFSPTLAGDVDSDYMG